MKKLLLSVAAVSAFAMSSSSAFAVCVAQGEITRILVNPGPIDPFVTTIWVRPSNPGSTTFQFTTGDGRVTSAAAAAQASHERVRVNGAAGVCSVPSLGLSQGGNIISIIVAPEI